MACVTLEEVKHHLRYDDDANDPALSLFLRGAESAVNNYITRDVAPDAGEDIKIAVLLLVGYYDTNRNIDKDTPNFGNYLPDAVRALLWPYRKPTAI